MTRHNHGTRSALAIAICAVASIAISGSVQAQGFVSPSIGYNAGSQQADCRSLSDCSERRRNYGVGIGYLGGLFGFEQEFVYSPDFFGRSAVSPENSVTAIMSNLLVALPTGAVRPYGSIGLGALRTSVDFNVQDALRFEDAKLGWSYGGGVMILPWRHFGIRADVRQYRGTEDFDVAGLELEGSALTFSRLSASAVLRF